MNIVLIEQIILQLINSACPIALVFTMCTFKCSRKTIWIVFSTFVLATASVNIFLLMYFSAERLKQLFAFVLFIPSFVFLMFNTKDKLSQLIFNIFTAINALYLIAVIAHFITGALNNSTKLIWLDSIIRGSLFACIIFLFSRYLRRPYQFLANNMKTVSWRALSVIPLLFFSLVMFLGLYPHVRTDNLYGVVFLYVILCFVYYIIYEVFRNTYDLIEQQHNNDILLSQVQALQNHLHTIQRTEEQLRCYRHDMRHYTESIAVLLQNSNIQEALQLNEHFRADIDKMSQTRYCQNLTINAVLSSYLQQAADEGAKVSFQGDLPENLPCDDIGLAMVLANAIENARHALQKLPSDSEKNLWIRCTSIPQLVIEIANTFDGNIEFDKNHYPVTHEYGHGFGTKSILTFVKNNNAYIDYKAKNNIFSIRLLINNR